MHNGSLHSFVYTHTWHIRIHDESSKTHVRRLVFRTGMSDLLISCFRNQVPLQRGDSANKERSGWHLPANHKLRGSELTATAAGRDSTAESGQQQTRNTLYVPILFVLLQLVSMHARVQIFVRKFTVTFATVDFEIR